MAPAVASKPAPAGTSSVLFAFFDGHGKEVPNTRVSLHCTVVPRVGELVQLPGNLVGQVTGVRHLLAEDTARQSIVVQLKDTDEMPFRA